MLFGDGVGLGITKREFEEYEINYVKSLGFVRSFEGGRFRN